MCEAQEIKQNNADFKMALIVAGLLALGGSLMLMFGDWKAMFFGAFFDLGAIVLVGIAISRKKTVEKMLDVYLLKMLRKYFKERYSIIRFSLEKKKGHKGYIVYVNGYVNKDDFEVFMQNIKNELGIKFEHRLLRRPKNSI